MALKEFEVVARVQEYKGLKLELDRLEARKKELEAELKADMTEKGIDELTAGIFKVTWKEYSKTALDTARLKTEKPELYQEFSVTKKEKRFLVK